MIRYTLALLGLLTFTCPADTIRLGAGSYSDTPPPGVELPPTKNYWSGSPAPAPTNDWCSSIVWQTLSSVHFPHPLAAKCEAGGLRIACHGAHLNASERAVVGGFPGRGDDLTIGLAAAEPFAEARLGSASDWFVKVLFQSGAKALRCSYGHGWPPFVFVEAKGGPPTLAFSAPPKVWHRSKSALGITTSGGNHYGVFSPKQCSWAGVESSTWERSPAGGSYLTVALLPDGTPDTLALFEKHAHAHVVDTKVAWRYDAARSAAVATFTFQTTPRAGDNIDTLTALYPHQWRRSRAEVLPLGYDSIRGRMKLFAGNTFEVVFPFPGVLPCLPLAIDGLEPDLQALAIKQGLPKDTYWGGKALGNLASASAIAAQYPDRPNRFPDKLKAALEDWFSYDRAEPKDQHFFYEENWGALIGSPPSYGSSKELNDHHFHYGYFIRAAAELARLDPGWAKRDRWGAIVGLLIDDIACPRRDDPKFPFLRNFDPYAGHSWASGHARFADGNNQESSSEAMSAWTGLVLWGQFTGDSATRDLGIYLFASELAAIEEYWFDISGENYPPAFTPANAAMVWGGKSGYETWFSDAPHCKTGINILPLHGGSLYLGRYPDYVRKNYEFTLAANGGGRWKGWPSIMIGYRALYDAGAAASDWKDLGDKPNLDSGNFKANAVHWIENLRRLGQLDRGVTCDHPLSATFKSAAGKSSHAVYHSGPKPAVVTFSDGTSFEAAPGRFTVR